MAKRTPPRLPIDRRKFITGSLGTIGLAGVGTLSASSLLAACTSDGSSAPSDAVDAGTDAASNLEPRFDPAADALAKPGGPGLIDEEAFQRRADEYLLFTTAMPDVESPTGIAAQLLRSHREPGYTWDTSTASVESLASVWKYFDEWLDVRDFRLLYFQWVLALADGSTPTTTLAPDLLARIKRAMLENRYRFDDPLPEGVVDQQVYMTENHLIIGYVCEYLAGQRFPTDTFTITGLTGEEIRQRARQPILDWIDERSRFGFFEFHSHVYMLKNITPLLTLAELADDPELVRAAGMGLDLCLFDMAAHTHRGTYTAPRGRTYKKDKMTARDENTFSLNKLIFDDTEYPHEFQSDTGAVFLSAAKRYRPPQVLVDIATAANPGVVRERHGIFVDGAAPVTENPVAPHGYDFNDLEDITFWWSQGAVGLWQTTDLTLEAAEKYQWDKDPTFAPIQQLIDLNGGDPDRIKAWSQANYAVLGLGHLRQVDSYAWRGEEVAMATAQDYRFGQMHGQVHIWQATVDANAIVFTTHPRTEPDKSLKWRDDSSPGYWTGEASMPRSAQHERTGVHIYQPAWGESSDPILWGLFAYRPYTHAFFPQDSFDEVVTDGNWTIGRKGRGYIALWSWRAPTWREYDPAEYATYGMVKPYDLVAEGGPDNVWIVEVGEESDGDFETWRASVTGSEPTVERTDDAFTVAWTSPSSGEITFGSTGDFTVAGEAQQLKDFPRHTSRFGTVDHLSRTYSVSSDKARLELDFEAMTRTVE